VLSRDAVWTRTLRHPVLVVFVLIMVFVGGAIYLVMVDAQRRIIEHEALKIAEVVARLALASRSAYSTAVADKLREDGFGPHIDYDKQRGFVPLPAQFLKLVGQEAARDSDALYLYRPLSKWNLEPTQGVTDDFQRWAWGSLEAQDRAEPQGPIDWQPVSRLERVGGVAMLRYMRADPASTAACVNCHNQYEKEQGTVLRRVAAGVEPGKQWRQYQLLGAIEVSIPLDKVEALAAEQTRHQTVLLVLLISTLGLSLLAWLALQDIRRKQVLAAQFERQAKYDPLTALPNRNLFNERAAAEVARGARDGTGFGVLFIDLDHFKTINDSLGHAAGDRVLREVARRLASSLREVDTVARLSGDEFAVLLHGVSAESDLARVAEKLLQLLARPYRHDDANDAAELFLSASIGISSYPQDGDRADALVKNADVAMYRAKESGRNSYQFFSADMNKRATETLAFIGGLRQAQERGQFVLHYQPRIAVATGRITSVEALLRWRHPELGLLLPARFLGLAEDFGLIGDIGDWVLEEALGQAKAWRAGGLEDCRVAVNVSPRQFRSEEFGTRVAALLVKCGVPPALLELEITEGAVMHHPEAAERVLGRFHDLGITLAVDDFGTGYSSLSYLKRFPIDYLKIDKSFVAGLPADPEDRAITQAIIAMAQGLRIKVVAEGVETEAQRAYLARQGCDELQGHLLAPPCDAEGLKRFIAAMRTLDAPLRPTASHRRSSHRGGGR
jgi:diguanylate cyclase (GGDEF)-like protein